MRTRKVLPRKILMTTDAVGGVWTYSLELARALAPHGVEVLMVAMGPPPSESQRLEASTVLNMELVELPVRLEWMEEPWDDLDRAGEELLRLAEEHRVELVHLNGYVHAALPWKVPCLVVAHSCVLSWWKGVRRGEAPASWNRYRHAVREGLRAASLVIAPTEAMLRSLEENYLPLPHGAVIHNARTPSLFHPGRKSPLVLTAGRLWDEAKNVAAVERVAAHLPWPVAVAGEDSFGGNSAGPLANVRHLGKLSTTSLASWYASASIYALPARYEPFGLTPLEAALSGCCLVLGDIATLRELWQGCAMFVHPERDDDLQRALLLLMTDESLRYQMVRRAAARAVEFSPARMADRYAEAYSSLAGRSARVMEAGNFTQLPGGACA